MPLSTFDVRPDWKQILVIWVHWIVRFLDQILVYEVVALLHMKWQA